MNWITHLKNEICFLIWTVSMLGLSFSQVQAMNYYEGFCEEEPCCEYSYTTIALVLGAATIAGAVTGVAAASPKHHHSGSSGDSTAAAAAAAAAAANAGAATTITSSGTVVPITPHLKKGGSFHRNHEKDAGISFFFDLDITLTSPTSQLSLIHFVEYPNGKVIQGDPILITSTTSTPLSLTPLHVDHPLYGTYHAGVSIFDISLVSGDAITLHYTALTSPDELFTSLTPSSFSLSNFNVSKGYLNQLTSDFTYMPCSD